MNHKFAPKMLALLLLLASCLAGAAGAQSPMLVLDGPARDEALSGHVDALLEAGEALAPSDLVGPDAAAMTPVPGAWPDFGYVSEAVWLRFAVRNASDVDRWRLHFRENFMQEFAVFAVRADGRVDTLYDIGPDSPFSARPIAYPEMVAPLRLAPGETATILVRYRSGGSSHLAFAVETLESFTQIATARTAKGYVFYGMVILLITVGVIALALFRRAVFAAYTAYAGAALLYIMHADGVAFQVLWPNWPAFNAMASVVTGSGIIVFGAIYARVFLETKQRHPWLDRALLGIIGVTLGLDVALWSANPQLLKMLLVIFSMVAIVLFAVSGIVAARTRFREVRFYALAWIGVVASAVLLNARHVFGIEISQDVQYDSMRAALVFDALMLGLAIADRYNTLRRARRAAQDEALEHARENARLAGRVARLGARYERARAVARGRGEILEDTIHDLRQPMQGLRLALAGLETGEADRPAARSAEMSRFESSLAYMERLIEDRIESHARIEDAPVEPAAPARADPSRTSAHAVLRSVERMFAPDAEAKGIELRLILTAPDREVPSFALMRVVSNLVSNAIKFTEAGTVLLALRPEGGGLRVEVHDTGPGLGADDFAAAQHRNVRLDAGPDAAEGSGLGLAIAARIAREEGWRLARLPCRREGARLALHMPAQGAAGAS